MSMFEVWLLLVMIPKLPILFVPVAIISAISIVVSIAWGITCYGELRCEHLVQEYKKKDMWSQQEENYQQSNLKTIKGCKKIFKVGLITLFTSSLLVAASPDKKEVAAIVIIPYLSNNPEFQKLPENIVGMLNDLIKEYRQELSPTKETEHE